MGKDNGAPGKGPPLWCESPEVCGRNDSRDPKENSVTHFSLNTALLLQAPCHPVNRQRKRSHFLSSQSSPTQTPLCKTKL